MIWMDDMKTVLRYEIPVDDDWHTLNVQLPMLHVAARHPGTCEFWTQEHEGIRPNTLQLRVFGTGHLIPEDASYFGTGLAPYGLVWHLFGYVLEGEETPGA